MSFIEEVRDSNVSAHAKIVAITICSYRNRRTGECFPSLQLLSETLQLSQNTIQKCLRELEAEKIIEIRKVRKFTSSVNSYVFLTENKALPKVDTSIFDVSKNDTSKIDTSVDTSNHTSKFDYKPTEPTEPIPPTPLKGAGVGVCLKDFYQSNNQQDFKEKCFLIAKARKHTDDDASKHFEQFENYWLNPALPASKASKKDWQRAFINWIAKTKPSKTSNVKVAEEILEKAKERLAHLLDENSTQLDNSLVFLRALKSGTTKEDIYKILVGIMNNPPPTKIYSWAIINQYA